MLRRAEENNKGELSSLSPVVAKGEEPPFVSVIEEDKKEELSTSILPVSPELDGARKAFALFNAGVISKDEIDDYAFEFTEKERAKQLSRQKEEEEVLKKKSDGEIKVAAATQLTFDAAAFAWKQTTTAASQAVQSTANAAATVASNAITKTAKSASSAVSETALKVADTFVDVTFRNPARAAKNVLENVATWPQRALQAKIDALKAAPGVALEAAAQRRKEKQMEAAEQAKKLAEAARNVPLAAADAALVTLQVAASGARLAAKNLAKTASSQVDRTKEDFKMKIKAGQNRVAQLSSEAAALPETLVSNAKNFYSKKGDNVLPREEAFSEAAKESTAVIQTAVTQLPETVAEVISGVTTKASESVAETASRMAREAQASALASAREAAKKAQEKRQLRRDEEATMEANQKAALDRFAKTQLTILEDIGSRQPMSEVSTQKPDSSSSSSEKQQQKVEA